MTDATVAQPPGCADGFHVELDWYLGRMAVLPSRLGNSDTNTHDGELQFGRANRTIHECSGTSRDSRRPTSVVFPGFHHNHRRWTTRAALSCEQAQGLTRRAEVGDYNGDSIIECLQSVHGLRNAGGGHEANPLQTQNRRQRLCHLWIAIHQQGRFLSGNVRRAWRREQPGDHRFKPCRCRPFEFESGGSRKTGDPKSARHRRLNHTDRGRLGRGGQHQMGEFGHHITWRVCSQPPRGPNR